MVFGTSRKALAVTIVAGALGLMTASEAWAQRGGRGGSHGSGGHHGGGGFHGGYRGHHGGYGHGGYRGHYGYRGYHGGYGYGGYRGYRGYRGYYGYPYLGLGAAAFYASAPLYYPPAYAYYPPPYYPPPYAYYPPPGAYPPGAYPPGAYPPSAYPPGSAATTAPPASGNIAAAPGPRGSQDEAKMLAMRVQLELMRRNYYGGAIDGKVGPVTRKGLTDFQRDNRLSVTGTIDGQTLSALGVTWTS